MKSQRFLDLVHLEEREAAQVAHLQTAISLGTGNARQNRAQRDEIIQIALSRGIQQIEHPSGLDKGTLLKREPNGFEQLSMEEQRLLAKKAQS